MSYLPDDIKHKSDTRLKSSKKHISSLVRSQQFLQLCFSTKCYVTGRISGSYLSDNKDYRILYYDAV